MLFFYGESVFLHKSLHYKTYLITTVLTYLHCLVLVVLGGGVAARPGEGRVKRHGFGGGGRVVQGDATVLFNKR